MGKVSNSNQKLEKNKHDWGAKKMLKEFPVKRWSFGGINSLIRRTDSRQNVNRKVDSG